MPAPLNRRQALSRSARVAALLAGAGLLPVAARAAAEWPQAAFNARTLAEVVKSLGGAAPVESRDLLLKADDSADNGAAVPLGVSTRLSGVRRLALLVEKNPNALAALFEPGDSVEADFGTRVKMSQSSAVYAVALMNDGRVLYAHKQVAVTIGGCGN